MGGGKQTTTSNSEPWKAAQPALQTAVTGAQNLYNKGVGGAVYTGSTVIPFNKHSTQGMAQINQNAVNNTGGKGLSAQYQGIINNGGLNTAQQNAMKNTQSLANSTYAVGPELQAVLDQNGAKMGDAVNLSASGMGRYGSGSHQGVLASSIGEMRNNAILSDYQNFQGRKDAANNSLFGMGQQGFSNLGTAYTGMNAPNQDMLNVGAAYEDLAKRYKDDELRIFNEHQNLPWEQLSKLNAIASGAGQMGGTTRQTQPGQNPFLTALGYGATGAGLLGSFF